MKILRSTSYYKKFKYSNPQILKLQKIFYRINPNTKNKHFKLSNYAAIRSGRAKKYPQLEFYDYKGTHMRNV